MTALTHAKTHQRNVSHISLASTSASSGFGPVRSSCSSEPENEQDCTPLASPQLSPRTAAIQDVIALVDKNAFKSELDVAGTVKRFKTAAACEKWLGKCLHRARCPHERIVLVVKALEAAALLDFLRACPATPQGLLGCVVYGGPAPGKRPGVPIREVASLSDVAPAVAALIQASPRVAASRSWADCPVEDSSAAELVGETVWIDTAAMSGPAVRSFPTAARAIGHLDRTLKLWHGSCAECRQSKRCARHAKSSRGKPAWPWLGEQTRALVAAPFAPALAEYLARFDGLAGPFREIAVYGERPERSPLEDGPWRVFPTLDAAVAHFAAQDEGKGAEVEPPTREPSSSRSCSCSIDLEVAGVDLLDDAFDVDCPTPTPLDYDNPWPLHTEFVVDGQRIAAPLAVPARFEKPFPHCNYGDAEHPATQHAPANTWQPFPAAGSRSEPFPCVLVDGVPCIPCLVQGDALVPVTGAGMRPLSVEHGHDLLGC